MKLVTLLVLLFTLQVLSQTSVTPTCSNPCFASGTTPCDPASKSCTTQCKSGTTCEFNDKLQCYNCSVCQTTNCLVDPCSNPSDCAVKSGAKCVADYCGGCNAHYYDANGAEICKDVVCTYPPCAYCQYGFESDPATGCQTCTCKQPTCNNTVTCKMYCQFGWAKDPKTGCDICSCYQPVCPDLSNCTEKCTNGYATDANGCKYCKCNPVSCLKACTTYKVNTDGSSSCDCACPPKPTCNTFVACTKGFVVDADGCQTTCECNPDTDVCKPVDACTLPCKVYKTDANGCKLCECDNPICPAVLCLADCPYGTLSDYSTGCPSCQCAPCPAVKCALFCDYGFAFDAKTKCPTCTCNAAPICDSTSVSVASTNTSFCDLFCKLGYVVENGCKRCACLAEPPCDCDVALKKSDPVKCTDGKTISDYTICMKSDKNICTWTKNLCPVGIKIILSGTFTSDYLKDFISKYQLNEKEVTFTASVNKDGKQEVIFWVKGEWLPKDTADTTVASDVEKSVKSSGSTDAYAFVISGESQSSTSMSSCIFVSIISLIGFLLA